MKSDKAKQFLDTKQPGDIAQYEVSMSKAEKAVEIAEAACKFADYIEKNYKKE